MDSSSQPQLHRHLLICGSPGTGKTSLLITLAREVFLPAGKVPRRFDGWTITVNGQEAAAAAAAHQRNRPLERSASVAVGASTSGSAATGSGNGCCSPSVSASASPTGNGGVIHITLWEDWPRRRQKEEEEEEEEEDESEEGGKGKQEEEEGDKREEEATPEAEEDRPEIAANGQGLQREREQENRDPNTQQLMHRIFKKGAKGAADENTDEEEGEEEDPGPPPGFVPPTLPPSPCPPPSILLMCFSPTDMDSFVELETSIWPELDKRYPGVPSMLVAAKCDLREQEERLGTAPLSDESKGGEEGEEGGEEEKGDEEVAKRQFIVTSDMGISMAKRIGAKSYIECSAQAFLGLDVLKSELASVLLRPPKQPLLSSSASNLNGSGSGSDSPTLSLRKWKSKRSAPNFLPSFVSGSGKRKSNLLRRAGKAASLSFIGGASAGNGEAKEARGKLRPQASAEN